MASFVQRMKFLFVCQCLLDVQHWFSDIEHNNSRHKTKGNSDWIYTHTQGVLLTHEHIMSTAVWSEKIADSCPALQQLEIKLDPQQQQASALTGSPVTQLRCRTDFYLAICFLC